MVRPLIMVIRLVITWGVTAVQSLECPPGSSPAGAQITSK
jgi:hypothetical protein